MANNFNAMLDRIIESRPHSIVPDISREAFSLSQLSMVVARFFIDFLHQVQQVPFYSWLVKSLFHKGVVDFIIVFSFIKITMFLVFYNYMIIAILDCHVLKPTLHSGINPILSLCIIFLLSLDLAWYYFVEDFYI